MSRRTGWLALPLFLPQVSTMTGKVIVGTEKYKEGEGRKTLPFFE
jgi:hypothetical protein